MIYQQLRNIEIPTTIADSSIGIAYLIINSRMKRQITKATEANTKSFVRNTRINYYDTIQIVQLVQWIVICRYVKIFII